MVIRSLFDNSQLYFLTTALADRRYRFLHLEPYVAEILGALRFQIEQKRIALYAFVIMANHLHLLWQLNEPYTVSTIMHSIKSFSSKRILQQLAHWRPGLFTRFQHHLWKYGFHKRVIYSQRFLLQKLEYIHNNPVARHWRLAEERHLYPYSSASFYDTGIAAAIELADARELLG